MAYLMGMSAQTAQRLERLSTAAKTSAALADDARVARNTAIVDADDEGCSIKGIARVCEMSPSHVQRILIAATAERQTAARSPLTED